MDVVESVIVGESREYGGSGGGSICNSLVSEFLKSAVSFEMSRGRSVAVTAGIVRATAELNLIRF